MRAHTRLLELTLRYPFGLSRGTASRLPTVLLRLGDVGLGEAPPVRYLQQDPRAAPPLLRAMAAGVERDNLEDRAHHGARALALAPAHSSARAAFDTALWDAAARARGVTLRAYLRERVGRDLMPAAPAAQETSYTIALDDAPAMVARARAASGLPILKVKLGRAPEFDADVIAAIRAAAPGARLRVDVNGGWRPEDAPRLCARMHECGVEFIEQPLPIGALEPTAALRRRSPVPIYADEDVQDARSLERLRRLDAVDGINIKLSKCGGITEALAMIAIARAHGWRVLLGCMIESRVGLSAAAQLADYVDAFDLDAHMLTVDDPVAPGSLEPAAWTSALPRLDGPGLGVPLDLDALRS